MKKVSKTVKMLKKGKNNGKILDEKKDFSI